MTAASSSLQQFKADAAAAANEALARVAAAATLVELDEARVGALGKKGTLGGLLRGMGGLDASERPEAGQVVNESKAQVEAALEARRATLAAKEAADRLHSERVDVSLPGSAPRRGRLHPVRETEAEIVGVLRGMGFRVVAGPEIEDDFHNFESLNFPHDHPARDMQDTFFLKNGLIPRTHTSPVQIRAMLRHKPPMAIVCPGRVYRCDADVTHSPMFSQIEGLVVDDHTTFGDLKGTLKIFIHRLFGPEIGARFRPSFFPFTEPSAEIDIACIFCKGKSQGCRVCSATGWLEIGGCGMVHPNVLRNVGIDAAKWQGFAFGLGVERVAMLRHQIDDIRLLFENDQRFLRQF
jgi:phenylalanyl-tRNA synthetase alpha chain